MEFFMAKTKKKMSKNTLAGLFGVALTTVCVAGATAWHWKQGKAIDEDFRALISIAKNSDDVVAAVAAEGYELQKITEQDVIDFSENENEASVAEVLTVRNILTGEELGDVVNTREEGNLAQATLFSPEFHEAFEQYPSQLTRFIFDRNTAQPLIFSHCESVGLNQASACDHYRINKI